MSFLPEIQEIINNIEIFDTHEHMAGFDWGFVKPEDPIGPTHPRKSLSHVLMNDMLQYICGSTGITTASLSPSNWRIDQAREYWDAMQPVLGELRATPVYTMIKRGLKELHGFEGDEITDDNFDELNEKVTGAYESKGAPAWMIEAMDRAKVSAIVQMAHLPYLIEYWPSLEPARREIEKRRVKPSLVLEPFIFSGFEPDRSKARERTMDLLGMHPRTHEEHLEFMHEAVKRHREAGGSALKFICAYQRTLHFQEVPDSEARRLYEKGPSSLDPENLVRLQDNLVWHLARYAKEYNFPIQLHTGYSNPTALGNPENLYNMVRNPEFREVNFYFCHAGWPHDGALALMARTFANVHFGFCWMPGLSPALATRLADEMFDLIPANKMLFGMDCGTVENFYGITSATRQIIAEVLAGKVDRGWISRQAAVTLANRVLRDNGRKLFGQD